MLWKGSGRIGEWYTESPNYRINESSFLEVRSEEGGEAFDGFVVYSFVDGEVDGAGADFVCDGAVGEASM